MLQVADANGLSRCRRCNGNLEMAPSDLHGCISDVHLDSDLARLPIGLYEEILDAHGGSRQEFDGLHDAAEIVDQAVSKRNSLVLVRSLCQNNSVNGFVAWVQGTHGD